MISDKISLTKRVKRKQTFCRQTILKNLDML